METIIIKAAGVGVGLGLALIIGGGTLLWLLESAEASRICCSAEATRVSLRSMFLVADGKEWRTQRLIDRKQELWRWLRRVPADSRLRYVDHEEGSGTALFERVCQLDLEGVVAKLKSGPYVSDREASTWFKICIRSNRFLMSAVEVPL